MAEESFVLVSLKEEKAKKLAQVLSNNTSRQILGYLSKHKEASETKIAKGLHIPLSTVHYNLKQLAETKLVNDEHFTYSKKGKEVTHYRLANKYVIIAPEETKGLKEKLRKILPVTTGVAVIGAVIHFFSQNSQHMVAVVRNQAETGAARDMAGSMAAPMIKNSLNQSISGTLAVQASPLPPVYWFLIGAASALGLYGIWSFYLGKK